MSGKGMLKFYNLLISTDTEYRYKCNGKKKQI